MTEDLLIRVYSIFHPVSMSVLCIFLFVHFRILLVCKCVYLRIKVIGNNRFKESYRFKQLGLGRPSNLENRKR